MVRTPRWLETAMRGRSTWSSRPWRPTSGSTSCSRPTAARGERSRSWAPARRKAGSARRRRRRRSSWARWTTPSCGSCTASAARCSCPGSRTSGSCPSRPWPAASPPSPSPRAAGPRPWSPARPASSSTRRPRCPCAPPLTRFRACALIPGRSGPAPRHTAGRSSRRASGLSWRTRWPRDDRPQAMVRFQTRLMAAAFVLTDVVSTNLAWILASFLRFHSDLVSSYLPVTRGVPALSRSLVLLPFISLLWPAVLYFHGLYQVKRGRSRIDEFFAILFSVLIATALTLGFTLYVRVYYKYQPEVAPLWEYSQGVIAIFVVLAVLALNPAPGALRGFLQ